MAWRSSAVLPVFLERLCAYSLFSDTQTNVDLERGHSCPPLRCGQSPSGQECPRSEKTAMRRSASIDAFFLPFLERARDCPAVEFDLVVGLGAELNHLLNRWPYA
jgi:hypothetical protein